MSKKQNGNGADSGGPRAELKEFSDAFSVLTDEIGKVIIGQKKVVRMVLVALFAGGHCLLEGLPGLGKTRLVTTLAECLDLDFGRIQFTPDLMPADITGTDVLVKGEGSALVKFQKGPVFTDVLLADEINRGTPRTQSALLEVMQERTVTVLGKTHELDAPFFVLATQNPIDLEGTYPLPEAQLDRFLFKINIEPEGIDEFTAILRRFSGSEEPRPEKVCKSEQVLQFQRRVREVVIPDNVERYIAHIVRDATPGLQNSPQSVRKYLRYGPSPRGLLALAAAAKVVAFAQGRANISFDDVDEVALCALNHRLIRNFEGESEGIAPADIVADVLSSARKKA